MFLRQLQWLIISFLVHSYYLKAAERGEWCSNDTLQLRAPGALLAVHHAEVASTNTSDCWPTDTPCREDLRELVSRECSGRAECEVYLPLLQLSCQGLVVVHYHSVPESQVQKFCNPPPLQEPEGYILSPGFPDYSAPLESCRWELEAEPGQAIRLELLAVALGPPPCAGRELAVFQGATRLLHLCGTPSKLPGPLMVPGHQLTITYLSPAFSPGTGFMVHYQFQGCPTLSPPRNAYLVYRNGSALYRCDRGFLFNDTLSSTQLLVCLGNQWNGSLTDCLSQEDFMEDNRNLTEEHLELLKANITTAESRMIWTLTSKQVFEDIIIPSILIISLLVITAVIFIIIILFRKKHKQERMSKDEVIAFNSTPGTSGVPPTAV